MIYGKAEKSAGSIVESGESDSLPLENDLPDGQVLLVQENDKRWSLPGGWCDVDVSVGENTVKEVREESGLEAAAELVIAIQDRAKHNLPPYAYGVCKIFVLCSVTGGQFQENIETIGYGYFAENDLPELAEEKNAE